MHQVEAVEDFARGDLMVLVSPLPGKVVHLAVRRCVQGDRYHELIGAAARDVCAGEFLTWNQHSDTADIVVKVPGPATIIQAGTLPLDAG